MKHFLDSSWPAKIKSETEGGNQRAEEAGWETKRCWKKLAKSIREMTGYIGKETW